MNINYKNKILFLLFMNINYKNNILFLLFMNINYKNNILFLFIDFNLFTVLLEVSYT
jgi:hypothetical protein